MNPFASVSRSVRSTGAGRIGPKQPGLRERAGRIYRRNQDDDLLQPLRVYVPLLALNSGLGGLAHLNDL